MTIVASSGDDGAFSRTLETDGQACSYDTNFPASSPYVTAVGATFGPESGAAEQACQADKGGHITSGGGFSTNAQAHPVSASQLYMGCLGSKEEKRADAYKTTEQPLEVRDKAALS